jgi:hypothetical protein
LRLERSAILRPGFQSQKIWGTTQANEGPTVFDWLLEVIREHGADGKYDGIELLLE